MYLLVAYLFLCLSHASRSQEQTEHRDFQYNSEVDPTTGRYNFAYDTGNDNDIAHTMHMQYRDADGIVRGRYGYTDPNGKLRVVEYEAGPNGFVARGDVGPDSFPHDQTPQTQTPQFARYSEEDFYLDPRPVQMAGWDPSQDPMGEPISSTDAGSSSDGVNSADVDNNGNVDGYSTTNTTASDSQDASMQNPNPYDDRYPRMFIFSNANLDNFGRRELESISSPINERETKSEVNGEEYPIASPLNINNIDVNPNDIRGAVTEDQTAKAPDGNINEAATGQVATARSADGDSARSPRALPYSYRNYLRQTHDHDGEIARRYASMYIPSHGHYHYVRLPHDHEAEKRYNSRYTHDHDAERRYYVANRQTHDHEAEKKYANNRQTHDHDAERRYYVANRQTHDHEAEKKYANNRQTHDHDAERRYYVANRQTHDHDAELRKYYDYRRVHTRGDEVAHTIYHQNNPNRRRVYYKDSHSQVPHEHYSDIYHNDNDNYHTHSDAHLYYGRYQRLEVPPTVKPGAVKYISSDKYHDKYYYWND